MSELVGAVEEWRAAHSYDHSLRLSISTDEKAAALVVEIANLAASIIGTVLADEDGALVIGVGFERIELGPQSVATATAETLAFLDAITSGASAVHRRGRRKWLVWQAGGRERRIRVR